ncbi:MAG: S41 family peptidase [Candidatus Zambryskibacteria bacterium]|nr:S41 family peptidase [Candidatus Zambryskibacteria bacterium]
MKEKLRAHSTVISIFIVLLAVVFSLGYKTGEYNVSHTALVSGIDHKTSVQNVDFDAFWKAWTILNEKYVPTTSSSTPTDQEKVWGAIQGLAASTGDPYTVFFPPVEAKAFDEQISGAFEGVGMEVDVKDSVLTVIAPLKDTPAYKAGIKAGDKLIGIDKKSTQGISTPDAIKKIKGKKGTTVTFTILREGNSDPIEISVVRDVITVPAMKIETSGDVFIIRMYSFSAQSADEFRKALRQFVESGKTKLVLDLRGNPGGYLEAAVDMASWFLPSGKVIVSEESKNLKFSQEYRSKGYNIFSDQLKFAILIDGGSASASEILAGALSDYDKAILVGKKSYGKGSVQELVPITPETSLKVTIAKWLTPKGHSISKNGIDPQIEVELDVEKFKKTGEDTQLKRAIEELNK